MKRDLYDNLIQWKNNPHRKPLVVKGARQVGKTYLIEEFGKNEFDNCIILNCDKDPRIRDVFENGFRTDRIISDISVLSGQRVIPGKTLVFIDEVGDAPKALGALKYFCEDAPQYHIIVAGSLLGLAIHKGVSFPVGKVDELTLYPLSFPEFVRARLGDALYKNLKEKPISELSSLNSVLEEALREYYFTGGMPEVVQEFINKTDFHELRNIQKRILADYSLDISKHADASILGRIHQVWNSIPQQLAKCNSKFIYGNIQKGARAKDYEAAIGWLIDAGMIYRIPRVSKPGIPLKFYEDFSSFKLFVLDHGLMGAMVDAPISEILLKKNAFEEYKGAFTEQYVLEQLICSSEAAVFFFNSDTSKLELDFLLQQGSCLVPVEVKAEENLRSKSLRQFHENYPDSKPIRISMSAYREQDWMINIPLYAAFRASFYYS